MPCNKNCEYKCGKGKAHPNVVKILDCKYRMLRLGLSYSLLKKYLTPELFEVLKWKKTKYRTTLLNCILTGVENFDSVIGVYAACPHSYDVFADLFDPIIQEYHGDFKKSFVQPPVDWGQPDELENADPDEKYIISTKVKTVRSIQDYPFNPGLTEEQYLQIENKVVFGLRQLKGDVEGQYVAIADMTPDEIDKMIEEDVLFKEGDRYINAGKAYRYWPTGRGYYYNLEKTFLVWVNEEEHMCFISQQQGGNLTEVYKRLAKAMVILNKKLKFAKHERLGYLSMCPSNLGTGIKASVKIQLPKLSADKTKLKELATLLNLEIGGTTDKQTESEKEIIEISNKRRLGITEIEVMRELIVGIKELITVEQTL